MVRSLLLLAAIGILAGCNSDSSTMMNTTPATYYGETMAFGSDSIHSWIKTGSDGKPSSMGVTFSAAAVASLERDSEMMTMLMLPTTMNGGMMSMMATPFDHIEVDWVPGGDPEPSPYDSAHLDCHFFTMSVSGQMGMMGGMDTTHMDMKYLPHGYMMDSVSEEGMGVHCMDTTAREFHGGRFDHTFVYGFYHGKMAFMETMCAKSFLDTKTNYTGTVSQPDAFKTSGYYPMQYSVKYDATARIYTISIDNLTMH